MMLVDVGADDLTHLDKVFGQEAAVVLANAPGFVQTLVRVERELLSLVLE